MRGDLTLLTFGLGGSWYGVLAPEVQEVILLPELTPLPDAPPFVSGMFDLRGRIVTVIDLRQRLGLSRRPWDLKTAVIITPFHENLYGLMVDEALALLELPRESLEPAPDFSSFLGTLQDRFVAAVGKANGRLVPILDLNRIFTIVEAYELSEIEQKRE